MPTKLKNPAAKRTPVNYSIESRIIDIIADKAVEEQVTDSEIVNRILRHYFGIVK